MLVRSWLECRILDLYIPVPVAFRVFVERGKHDGKNDLDVVADQIAEVLVVPEVEGSLGDLEVRAGYRFGELMEKRLLYLGKLGRVHDLKDVFNFVKEHNFFGAIHLGPVAKEAEHNLIIVSAGARLLRSGRETYLLGQGSVLLEELNDAVRQLRVVHAEALDFVQGDQDTGEEELVLILER